MPYTKIHYVCRIEEQRVHFTGNRQHTRLPGGHVEFAVPRVSDLQTIPHEIANKSVFRSHDTGLVKDATPCVAVKLNEISVHGRALLFLQRTATWREKRVIYHPRHRKASLINSKTILWTTRAALINGKFEFNNGSRSRAETPYMHFLVGNFFRDASHNFSTLPSIAAGAAAYFRFCVCFHFGRRGGHLIAPRRNSPTA